MAGRYAYVAEIDGNYEAADAAVLVEESVVWDQDSFEPSNKTVAFSNGIEITGDDNTSDSYLTADEASATEYFSILENTDGEVAFGDVTLVDEEAAGTEKHMEDAGKISVEADEVAQPVIFRVEGSDDLFAVDMAYDDQGNLQRYQYKLRANENGEYESIPESVELLPLEVPESVPSNVPALQQNDQNGDIKHKTDRVVIKQEEKIWRPEGFDETHDQLHEEENGNKMEVEDSQITKVGIQNVTYQTTQELRDDESLPEILLEDTDNNHAEVGGSSLSEVESETEEFIFENFTEDLDAESGDTVRSQHSTNTDKNITPESDVNNSDTEDLQIVDGEHVTGDVEEEAAARHFGMMSVQGQILKLHQESCPSTEGGIIRIAEKDEQKSKKTFTYVVVSQPEKENVALTQVIAPVLNSRPLYRVNPRSILKSSHSIHKRTTNEVAVQPSFRERRHMRSKEYNQQRQYSSLLSKTTIVQAPVRNGKQPRKQTITPVTRSDEEIIVQEVAVSSKGFVEALARKPPVISSEIVQVSDSDDEPDPHKKKDAVKIPEIVISDSDDERAEESSESNTAAEGTSPSKRKRGRPPKKGKVGVESPSKKAKSEVPSIRTDWKCENCAKTFPSEGALKSHMQYHIYHEASSSQESLAADATTFRKPELIKSIYMCKVCGDSFKNNVLLTRHSQLHGKSSTECSICKKILGNMTELVDHKKAHAKQRMVLNTSLSLLPKRLNSSSSKIAESPVKKCAYCSKTFSTVILLNAHVATHKRFTCPTCSTSFVSKLSLNEHILKKCLKSPLRRSRSFVNPNETLSASTTLQCKQCDGSFSTYTALFQHKVSVHGLETPDKKFKDGAHKSSMLKGVPPSAKFKKAFAGLRSQLGQ